MDISVEISMYPLGREYVPEIKAFIERIKKHQGIDLLVSGMSTQIFGEYQHVMTILKDEMAHSFERDGKCVFVMKVVDGNLKK